MILSILFLKGRSFLPQVHAQCLSRAPAIAPCARDSRWHIRATLDWPPWLQGIISQHSRRRSRATKRLGEGSGFAGTPPHGSLPRFRFPRVRRPWPSRLRPRRLVARERLGECCEMIPRSHGCQSRVALMCHLLSRAQGAMAGALLKHCGCT